MLVSPQGHPRRDLMLTALTDPHSAPFYFTRQQADTPFEGGSFSVKMVLGGDYPNSPPRGFFLTRIFHPNVSATGDICVNTLKKDWTSSVTLSHVMQVIRCLLIVPFPESSLNDEAGKLFMESYDEYHRRAKLLTSVHAMPRKGSPSPEVAAAPSVGGGSQGAEGTKAKAKAAPAKKALRKKNLRRL
ncbi:unnamed protein product [Chrysoparadoxa australica]